jgi:hypothetical protein
LRSAERSPIDQLIYPLAYLYDYHLQGPLCALTVRTGIERKEGVSRMNAASHLRPRCAVNVAQKPMGFILSLTSTGFHSHTNAL